MEKRDNKTNTITSSRGGFSISDKKSSSSKSDDVINLMHHHHQVKTSDLNRPFVGGGGDGIVGPFNCTISGGANEALGNIYNHRHHSPSFVVSIEKSRVNSSTNLQQPFDVSHSAYNYSSSPFKSLEGMSTNVGFPFTSAQWDELERQAMIYKFMVSSVPVPPDLLFPLSRNYAAPPPISTLCNNNTRYSKNGDPEPGRCRRTDGKKWRCSRDVAPHQKYCERHLHRGRPRSRKPVEVKNNNNGGENHKKTRLEQTPLSNCTNTTVSQQFVQTTEPLLLFNAAGTTTTDLSISGAPSYKGTNRDLSLIVENEMVAMEWAEQQWKHLMESKMGMSNEMGCSSSIYGSNAPSFHQDYGNFFGYSAFPSPEIEAPIGFIDAWSIDNLNKVNPDQSSLSPNNGNLSPSLNLSMAMAAGNVLDEEMSKIQVEDETKDCVDLNKTNEFRWLSPVSWEPFSLGGPLAEALHPGSVAVSNPASPYDSMNSNQATTVSSPSGVLHRTLFSHSDGSVCNSPTLAVPPSEIAFQWLH